MLAKKIAVQEHQPQEQLIHPWPAYCPAQLADGLVGLRLQSHRNQPLMWVVYLLVALLLHQVQHCWNLLHSPYCLRRPNDWRVIFDKTNIHQL
jgi:hypothetical protein